MSSSRRLSKQFEEQQKRLLAQQEELFNLEEGGDEAFTMEEDEDDEHRRQRASHSRRVMEVVGQLSKPRSAANLDSKRKKRGAQNDLKGRAQSPVFHKVPQGKTHRVTYWVNGHRYEWLYYLVDGIYPRWTTFVKTVPRPHSEKEKHFAQCQEGCRNDVEHCFGILQAQWAIVSSAARMFDVEVLRSIMMTCIILHNMIVKDEYDYDAIDEYEPDTMNNSRTRIYCVHDGTKDPMQHEPLE
ncbi:uncharacterized protein [Malus domestica]|uniref:uncharacterized protein n=1 Tax=Malus domestica TaxID=3750 RepID=UPI003976BE24